MTTAGLTVYNDSGTIQIDQDFKNLSLCDHGVGTFGTGGYYVGNIRYQEITVTGTNVVIALECASLVAIDKVTVSGGDWTFRVVSKAASHGSTFNWWAFDNPTDPVEDIGLEVFDASGGIVFHSGNRYMRVVAFTSGTGGTFTSGRRYAVIQSQLKMGHFVVGSHGPPMNVRTSVLCSSVASNVVTTGASLFENYSTSIEPDAEWNALTMGSGKFLIIDVTDYPL